MRNFLLAFVFLVVITSQAHGEPSAVSKYLLNEPVTLMDLGVMRMKESLESSFLKKFYSLTIVAVYDEERDRILVHTRYKRKDEDNEMWSQKEWCKMLVAEVKGHITFGDILPWFNHQGYDSKLKPKELETKVMNLIEVESQVDSYKNGLRIVCKTSFVDEKIYISEEKL